ncbi:MAG: TonB-dependent receptor [Kiritimatiellae bacterium]|nr:TonB-dependent receptor [Kiritimatiellia bacterium]
MRTTNRQLGLAAGLALAVFAHPTTLRAEASPSVATNLPPIIVEASRLNKTTVEMPLFVELLTPGAIDAAGARDTTELLGRATGVFVRQLGGDNPALAQVAMRGYGENSFGRTLVVLDGERLNNPDMSAPNLARIPLDSIDHVEVLHGPQTVLHGDNASAGLVNVVTEPRDYKKKTTVEVKGGSWDTFGTAFATKGGFADEGVSYWGGASWLDSAGFRDRSDYELWNANAGVRKDWENGAWFKLSTFYSDAQYDLPGGLTKDEWKHHRRMSETDNDYARLYAYGLATSGYGVINDENAVKLSFTASHRSIYSHYEQGEGTARWFEHQDSSVYSYSITPQYIYTGRLGDYENKLIVGADYRYDTLVGHEAYTGSYVNSSKPDQSRHQAALFAQNEFFLFDELSFVLGSRLARNMARNELAGAAARNDNVVAYEAAVNWRPEDTAKVFLKWSRFYRNPFLDETPWYTNPHGSYVPKNLLAPERGYSVDFGGDWNFLTDFDLGGALFVSETKNEVFYDAGQYANVNSDSEVLRQGLEVHTGWEKDKVAGVHLRYTLTYAKFEEGAYNSNYVPLVPMHQIRLDGRVWLWDECFIRGGYQFCAKQVSCSDFANDADRLPAYGIFHAGIQYSPTTRYLKGFTFAFDVANLFDKNYANYSTYGSAYYPGAGRSCMFSVRYEF